MALLLRCLQDLRRKNGERNWFVASVSPWLAAEDIQSPDVHGNTCAEISIPQEREGVMPLKDLRVVRNCVG